MIKLVGTLHSKIAEEQGPFFEFLDQNNPDQLFVEGMSSQGIEGGKIAFEEELIDFAGRELDENFDEEEVIDAIEDINQGPEPGLVEEEWMYDQNKDDIVYLDDKRPLDHLEHTINEELAAQEQWKAKPIDEKKLTELIENGHDYRPNYLQFLKYSMKNLPDTMYSAIETSDNFRKGKIRTLNYFFDEDAQIRRKVKSSLEDYDIDQSEFQNIIEKQRQSSYQDKRDKVWYDQISKYAEENPEDDILVLAGLAHMIDTDNTLRSLLEQDYEVVVEPYCRVDTFGLPYNSISNQDK